MQCNTCGTQWTADKLGYKEAKHILSITGGAYCPDCHEVKTFKDNKDVQTITITRKEGTR